MSCATARRCWAVGVAGPNAPTTPGAVAVIVATDDGGTSWKPQHISGGTTPQLDTVSCPGPATCLAAGSTGGTSSGAGEVVATDDAGASWSPVTTPPHALTVTGVDCVSVHDCTAIVDDGTATWSAVTPDVGHTWQQGGDLPTSFQPGNGLSCSALGKCLVAGYVPTTNGHGQGAVALSTDGGQHWSLATVPAGTGVLRTTACASATVCLAAGTTSTTVSDLVAVHGALLRSTDGGSTWAPATSPPVDDVYGVACPSAQRCAMVGTKWIGFPAVGAGSVARSVDGGSSFPRRHDRVYAPDTVRPRLPDTRQLRGRRGEDTRSHLLGARSGPLRPAEVEDPRSPVVHPRRLGRPEQWRRATVARGPRASVARADGGRHAQDLSPMPE